MANIVLKLEKQNADLRSKCAIYNLIIENQGDTQVRLISIKPRIPSDASLLDIKESSQLELITHRSELISELNSLLMKFLITTSEDFKRDYANSIRDIITRSMDINFAFRIYAAIIFNTSVYKKLFREFTCMRFKIKSSADSRKAYDRWMKESTTYKDICNIFDAKTQQLEQIEAILNEAGDQADTTIDPGSFYIATYVIKFRRGIIEPRNYQVAYDVTYIQQGAKLNQVCSTTAYIQISPHPFSLCIIAAIGAAFGVFIKLAQTDPNALFIKNILALVNSVQLPTGIIIALIFFNIFEYTSIGKGINISIGWRSALLIGSLCGIAQDRVMVALKALIGG